jgi:hypothetical protein
MLLIAGLVLVVAAAAASLLLVPDSLRTPGAAPIPFALAALVACYAVVGVVVLRRPAPGDALGALFGIAAGLMWSIEIFAGGPARLPYPIEQAVGGTFVLAATVCTLAAGPVGAIRYQSLGATWRAGLYAGLISGLFVFSFAVPMTLATLDILGSRSDYKAQFARSGAPNMHAFLVQDILAGAGAHLIINALLGVIGAALATVVLLLVRSQGSVRPAAR